MGLKTWATLEEALEDAKKKYVGDNPTIFALPRAFKTTAMYLCMKHGPREDVAEPSHPCCG
ncbi:MAG: hypothetical protein J6C11_03365 [Spirochaetaceae bacterium]|nr:hypothetical protein [Spirochaetaceae bacterium]